DDTALVLVAAPAESLHLDRLAVHAFHGRLIVKSVDVARAAVHVEKDDALGLGREVRLLGGQGVDEFVATVSGNSLRSQEAVITQERGQGNRRKSGSSLPEK